MEMYKRPIGGDQEDNKQVEKKQKKKNQGVNFDSIMNIQSWF